MAVRLGNVLYWLGCILAVLTLIWRGTSELQYQMVESVPYLMGRWAGVFLVAAVPWLIGWALRYILSGPSLKSEVPAYERQFDVHPYLTAMLTDPVAGEKLTQAINEGKGVISAERWDEIVADLRQRWGMRGETSEEMRDLIVTNLMRRNDVTNDLSERFGAGQKTKKRKRRKVRIR